MALFSEFDFFSKARHPPIPIAEYWFFTLMPHNGPARCLTLHRIIDPLSFLLKRAECFEWNNNGSPLKMGKSRISTEGRRFKMRGDADCDLWQDGGGFHLAGKAFGEKLDVVANLGPVVKEASWHPKLLCRMHGDGLEFNLSLDQLTSMSLGRLYDIQGRYHDKASGEDGFCYFERVYLASFEPNIMHWDYTLVFFDDGTYFIHWESPYFMCARGVYIDPASGQGAVHRQASIDAGAGRKVIECSDGTTVLRLTVENLMPVQHVPFWLGTLKAVYHQAVGKVGGFSVNGNETGKTGTVYSDWVPQELVLTPITARLCEYGQQYSAEVPAL